MHRSTFSSRFALVVSTAFLGAQKVVVNANLTGVEYVAVFEISWPGTSYTLQLTSADAVFTEGGETLGFMVVPSPSADLEGLEAAEDRALAAWTAYATGTDNPVALAATDTAISPSDSTVYSVELAGSAPITIELDASTGDTAYTLLLEHGPAEVRADVLDPSGEVVVAAVEETHSGEEEDGEEIGVRATARQWAHALAASLVVTLCSLVGIISVMSSRVAHLINLSLAFFFASGALLTTAVVHVIPEAMTGLKTRFEDDLEGLFTRAGIMVMAGIFTGFLMHIWLSGGHAHGGITVPPLAVADPQDAVENPCVAKPVREDAPSVVQTAARAAGLSSAKGASELASSRDDRCRDGTVTENEEIENGTVGSRIGARNSATNGILVNGTTGHANAAFSPTPGTLEVTASVSRVEGSGSGEPSGGRQSGCGVVVRRGGGSAVESMQDLRNAGKGRSLFDVKGLDPVCWNTIVGDIAHNFADGMTMGAAFLGCSLAVGWTVTAANLMHEIPHEFVDFMVLVNGGMSVTQALVYNVMSALFALLGVVLVLVLRDFITAESLSYILLLGAGMFIFVALAELMPDALEEHGGDAGRSKRSVQSRRITAFALGALLLGLPLLSHHHCGVDDHGHSH